MSVEEAKKVTASFSGASFVPPPRTIVDIATLVQPDENTRQWMEKQRLNAAPPSEGLDDLSLGRFYYRRALTNRRLGRFRQAAEDFSHAAELVKPGTPSNCCPWPVDLGIDILKNRAETEAAVGDYWHAIAAYNDTIAVAADPANRGVQFELLDGLAQLYATTGDLKAAESALERLRALFRESQRWNLSIPELNAAFEVSVVSAEAAVLELRGRYREAESQWRHALALLKPLVDSKGSVGRWLRERFSTTQARLSMSLLRQDRLVEAEVEGRAALRSKLTQRNIYSFDQVRMITLLARILREQGRYAESETLARAAIAQYELGGASAEGSPPVVEPARELAAALVAQDRWHEAVEEYEGIRQRLNDPQLYARLVEADPAYFVALVQTGRCREAVGVLARALAESVQLRGERHPITGELRGLLGVARTCLEQHAMALQEFSQAMPVLTDRTSELDSEGTTTGERDRRFRWIVARYIGLLYETQTVGKVPNGVDVSAETFRLADIARGRFVQRALDATAARSAVRTPVLADLVRREQDAAKQIAALQRLLTTAFDGPSDPRIAGDLRGRIDGLTQARHALLQQIAKDFPAYAHLVNPLPVTVQQAREALRPGEALIATLVTEETTFVWGVPAFGPVEFVAVPLGERMLAAAVAELRKALEPNAHVAGEIPPFDIARAHELYRDLLEPVKGAWAGASSLLVVAHGPLGQLPFSLLPTQSTVLGTDRDLLFSGYRSVPWLIRTHGVTTLPSVSSLTTLRTLPPGDPRRRPFVGFGNPYFSQAQAHRAAAEEHRAVEVAAHEMPNGQISVRSSPQTGGLNSSQLAMLPPLPETAAEIRGMALAMHADLTRDVFLGERASERTVRTLDLSVYRVIAFATHGLVPGDVDGLTQPALALTAPDIVHEEGDGLLTMEKILRLRLNADWVVLSACNTASAQGAGAEAISGLGRAFFYAGARALLVSNWPVETTSAKSLTTDIFRRQAADPKLTRARALQQTINALIDSGEYVDFRSKRTIFSYPHPIFWAPFTLVGDGGSRP